MAPSDAFVTSLLALSTSALPDGAYAAKATVAAVVVMILLGWLLGFATRRPPGA